MKSSSRRLLIEGLQQLGLKSEENNINSEESILKKFELYLDELLRWNRAYNITALKKEEEIIQKHFLDSLLFLPFLRTGMSVIDAGSGGGFPGLVLKIVRPDLLIHLVEPSRKKAAFLKHMVFKLKLFGIEVIQQRVEELQGTLMVDAIVSRALFKLRDIIKIGPGLLKEGGIIILNKGPEVYKEMAELKSLDIERDVKLTEMLLPTTDIKRYMIVVKL